MNTQYSAISLTGPKVNLAKQHLQDKRIRSDRRLNAAAFERFLSWLGPDPETAGQKYESIRNRLIMMFRARRCIFAEDLADATFERVVRKLTYLSTEFTGDPARYLYGVAKKIYLEYQREVAPVRWNAQYSLQADPETQELELRLAQLDEALTAIPRSDRDLILRYYASSGRDKINDRRALADQFGLRLNALRLRVFRIRKEIKNYMLQANAATPEVSLAVHVSEHVSYRDAMTN